MSRHKFVPELKEAKEVFEAAKADPKKNRLIEAREDAIRNYAAAMSQAKEEGIEEGEKIGIEKGKAEGEKIGIEKGANEKAIEVAKKMLSDGLTADVVAKYSGLSLQEVKKINVD